MVRIEKQEYKNGFVIWTKVGEARTYAEAIRQYNGEQTWWQKRDHCFEVVKNGIHTVYRMIKEG